MTAISTKRHPAPGFQAEQPAISTPVSLGALQLAQARLSLRGFAKLVDLILEWQERSRQRRHLATLDDNMLRDIGLSRADVDRETHKHFWHL
jgi:uncharacterized protein YjiS (DUF1127 family)